MRILKLFGTALTLIVLGTNFSACEKEKGSTSSTEYDSAYIILGEEELLFSSFGNSVEVSVKSNFNWKYTYESDWFSVKTNGTKSVTITYTTNDTGEDRKGIVSFTAGDGAKNIAKAQLAITQSWQNTDALILEYTITSNGTTIVLPVGYGTHNATIDWDDGNIETVSSVFPSHKYTAPGIYNIAINGSISRLDSVGDSTVATEYLTAVIQWGDVGLESMADAFYGCINLKSVPEETNVAFKKVTSFVNAFYKCSSLVTVPEKMFSGCSAVTSFRYAFERCTSLVSAPSFEGCSKATDFSDVFYGCTSLTNVPEKIFSGCSAAMDFSSVFRGCTSLTSVPEKIFSGCSAVTSFDSAFERCTSLVSAPSFEGCSAATKFSEVFYECTSLTNVPEKMFSGCSAVTSFRYAFKRCTSLVSAPSFEGCSKATDFSSVFYGCTSLTNVPEKIFSGCSAVTTFGSAFYGCSSLKNVPTSLFDDTTLVTDFRNTFNGCSSIEGESPYTEIEVNGEKVKVHLFERSNYAVEMRYAIPNGSNCFTGSSFSDIDSIPSDWGGNGN